MYFGRKEINISDESLLKLWDTCCVIYLQWWVLLLFEKTKKKFIFFKHWPKRKKNTRNVNKIWIVLCSLLHF